MSYTSNRTLLEKADLAIADLTAGVTAPPTAFST